MKITKTISLLLASVFILFSLSACMSSKKLSVDDVVAYCEEKYDDKFSVVATGTELWTDSFSELILASEALDGANINVRVYSKDEILDNYIAVKYKSAVEEKLSPIVNSLYGEALVVNVPVNYGMPSFVPDMSFEEYAKSADSYVHVAIATNAPTSEKDEAILQLSTELKKIGICASVTVSYFDVENINDIELSQGTGKVFKQNPIIKGWLNLNADFSVESIDWNEDNINTPNKKSQSTD